MREIKFRAWIHDEDIKTGWMSYNVYPMLNNEIYIDEDICEVDDSVKLMQYTGCKDKNEKKIWEGDIVKDNWKGIYFGDENKNKIGIIKFGKHDVMADDPYEFGMRLSLSF